VVILRSGNVSLREFTNISIGSRYRLRWKTRRWSRRGFAVMHLQEMPHSVAQRVKATPSCSDGGLLRSCDRFVNVKRKAELPLPLR
jgi:hypothetical protein